MTGGAGIFDGSEPWENSVGAQEATPPPSPPPAPLVSLVRDLETNGDGGGGGGGVKLGLHMVLHTLKLVLESWLQHTQDLLDVT